MKVVICAINSKYVHSSLAPWYLKASGSQYAQCSVVEGTINEEKKEIYERIVNESPDLVAFSTYIWNARLVLALAKQIKEETDAKILLGGPEVSYNASEILARYDFVDYIICGEGEEPFAKICKEEDLNEIEGLCYKKSEGVSIKPPFVSKKEPPNPYTDEYMERLNGRIAYIETSRGCPYNCAFCLSGRFDGIRFFDIEESKRRIVLLANSGTKTVKFIDRTFNADRKRARELFSFIINEYGNKISTGVCFHFEIEGELIDTETVEILKKAPVGLFQFEIGLQSFNAKTLEAINRKSNLDKLCEKIKSVLALTNIHVHIDLIAGLPYESYESFKNSFNLAYRLKPHMLQLGFLKLLSGTVLREKAEEYKCEFSDTPPYEIRSNKWISYTELEHLHTVEDVFEKMYNSQRFGLTCEYLDEVFDNPFEMYDELAKHVTVNRTPNTLDDLTMAIYNCFSSKMGVDAGILRDKLAVDRLATNRMGALPDFLKVKCTGLKKALNDLEKDEKTKRPLNVKRAATFLPTENRIAYVDYDECNYVSNRFLVKFTKNSKD